MDRPRPRRPCRCRRSPWRRRRWRLPALAVTLSLVAAVGPACGAPSADRAAEVSRVRVETSEGDFLIDVHRDWAPHGAERFLHLVEIGYYDDTRFHRVVPGFIVQWGLAGDPALTAEWLDAYIPDDSVRVSNTRGRIAFAFIGPGTRSTQVFINLADNARLDSAGFAPFGEVLEGLDVVERLYGGYGESSGGGLRRGDQSRIVAEGNAYLDREFPLLDTLHSATVEDAGGGTVGSG